jgi:hypothetical protein
MIRASWSLLGAALLLGCVERATLQAAPGLPAASTSPSKFHMLDGRLYVLDEWTAEGDQIRGRGREYGVERALVREGTFALRRPEVALVETSRKEANKAIIPIAIITGASVAASVVCLTNTKACFGSCPTFYVPTEGGRWALQAEGFSSSIARIFEADDLDDLPDARPEGGAITVAMRNEALETHMVRGLSLLAVKGPPGSAVLRGFRSGYLAVGPSAPASSCDAGDAGCAALAARDARELELESDGVNLAARTSVTLRWPAPGQREVALVLTARNSLMSTFVLYHMMALHGRGAGEFMASVERGDPHAIAGLASFDQILGGVEVSWRQKDGAFQPAGSLGYIGPIARATRGLSFAVDAPSEPVEVKLSFARAHWKIDAARLAPVMADGLAPVEILPQVIEAKGRDPAEVAASLRGQGDRVVTLPGDEIVLRFPLPAAATAAGSTGYFLHSRGYYYEWMRDEWLRDEDPAKARAYIDDPARALRELAPSYRTIEPSMESVFRASRFWGPAAP